METNVGKWTSHYAQQTSTWHYGDSQSYRIGAEALADCATIEDWGSGLGWFKHFVQPGTQVTAVDGSWSQMCDVVDDLATRRSTVEGIFMRHVLEHNYNWPTVLGNALESFTKRMVLVLFTPLVKGKDQELRFEDDYGVPTLALSRAKLMSFLKPFTVEETTIESPETAYGAEVILVIDHP
jgi:hypothetical protein